METKNIIQELRIKHDMSQEELANKIFVTRQAVSPTRPMTHIPLPIKDN